MDNFLQQIRFYDFRIYYRLYQLGLARPEVDQFFYFFARYGIVFFFLSFIYLTWKKKIRAFLCTLMAMGLAGTIDFLVYIFWQRQRPFVTYEGLVSKPDTYGMYASGASFPSSHTYVAFAIAVSVFLYGHRRLGSVLFILACMVAISRVGAGLHYPSDTIGGAIFGVISGVIVYFIVRKWERNSAEDIE